MEVVFVVVISESMVVVMFFGENFLGCSVYCWNFLVSVDLEIYYEIVGVVVDVRFVGWFFILILIFDVYYLFD